jgi:hypothetical protein
MEFPKVELILVKLAPMAFTVKEARHTVCNALLATSQTPQRQTALNVAMVTSILQRAELA